jgi:hypothetical protein
VFEAKFTLPATVAEEAAAEKHVAQLLHAMWVANARSAVLSIITGGGKWVEITIHADPLYEHLLLTPQSRSEKTGTGRTGHSPEQNRALAIVSPNNTFL